MLLRPLPLLSSLVFTSVLFACSGGTTTTSSSGGNPSPTGSSTSATDPPAKGGGGGSTGSALGASCKAYVACCEEVADSTPQLAASCDAFKSQVESGQANGVSTSSYEAACKSGLASFKSGGYCD